MRFAEVGELIGGALGADSDGAGTDGDSEPLAEALALVAEPAVLRALLSAAVADPGALAAIEARSVWHPNGFAKIVLGGGADFRLRLHVWSRERGRVVREDVHDHRWDFAAQILAGGYRHQEFRTGVRPGGAGRADGADRAAGADLFEFGYQTSPDGVFYSRVLRGKQTLWCAFDAHLAVGTRYVLRREVLHRVLPDPGCDTVSLVLEGPQRTAWSTVFSPIEEPTRRGGALERLGVGFVAEQLTALAARLSASGG